MADPEYRTFTLAGGVTYGPVQSRRFGASLGINILPFGTKVCSFNCNYCQCGWSTVRVDAASLAALCFPTAGEVAEGLRGKLADLAEEGRRLNCMTLCGNGEPTLHPDFLGVVRAVKAVRDARAPEVRLDILSNAAHLGHPGVVEGLNLLDERFMKLDAGSEKGFHDMAVPMLEVRLEDVLANLPRLKDFVVQAIFTRGRKDNAGEQPVQDWIAALRRVKPKAVHVYSVDRVPADPKIEPVDRGRLEEIARAVRSNLGIPVEVF